MSNIVEKVEEKGLAEYVLEKIPDERFISQSEATVVRVKTDNTVTINMEVDESW